MTTKKRPSSNPKTETLKTKIRNFVVTHGPMQATPCMQAMQKRKLLSELDVELVFAREFKRVFQEAFRDHDADGMPRGGPMPSQSQDEDAESFYGVRQQWLFPDYQANCDERAEQRDGLVATIEKLGDECAERFGRRPFSSGG